MSDLTNFAGHGFVVNHSSNAGEPYEEAKSNMPLHPICDHHELDTQTIDVADPSSLPGAKSPVSTNAWVPQAEKALCDEIRLLHRRAKFCVKQRIAIGNRLAAFVRTEFLGFSTFDDEDARGKAVAASQKLLAAIRKDKPTGLSDDDELALRSLVKSSDAAAEPFEDLEKLCTKRMVKLARQLPAYHFVQETLGFGEVSFARIVGETGSLANYANPGKLWKRMGLAVIGGERQRKHTDPELALAHGYNPSRRSVSWVAFEPVLKAQGASNQHREYRTLYDEAKARYLERGWTKLHAHRAAARYAEKRLLRDLWRAWHGQKEENGDVDIDLAA